MLSLSRYDDTKWPETDHSYTHLCLRRSAELARNMSICKAHKQNIQKKHDEIADNSKFVPFSFERYVALFEMTDCYLFKFATLHFQECAGTGPSISLLSPQIPQQSLGLVIHARKLCRKQGKAFLPFPSLRVPLPSAEVRIVASFALYVVFCCLLQFVSMIVLLLKMCESHFLSVWLGFRRLFRTHWESKRKLRFSRIYTYIQ